MRTKTKRTWKDLTPEERDQLATIYQNRSLTESGIAQFGLQNLPSVARSCRRHIAAQRTNAAMPRVAELEERVSPPLPVAIGINTEHCMVVGDVHVPTTSATMTARMLAVADKYLPKKNRVLIVAGDLFNLDAYSDYPSIETMPTLEDELAAGKSFINACADVFHKICLIPGNHERRVTKQNNGQLSFVRLAHMLNNEKLVVSNWGHIIIRSGGETYRATHARNYSVTPLKVANELAQKYQQHIIQHHEHHLAIGYDRFGRYLIINNGGLFDRNKIGYALWDDSKSPVMQPGFTMIREGTPTLFGNHPWTDWSKWL